MGMMRRGRRMRTVLAGRGVRLVLKWGIGGGERAADNRWWRTVAVSGRVGLWRVAGHDAGLGGRWVWRWGTGGADYGVCKLGRGEVKYGWRGMAGGKMRVLWSSWSWRGGWGHRVPSKLLRGDCAGVQWREGWKRDVGGVAMLTCCTNIITLFSVYCVTICILFSKFFIRLKRYLLLCCYNFFLNSSF